jgi:SAM-dependent methyltransferase
MSYTHSRETAACFKNKGLQGYAFGPLKEDADFYYIEVEKGHDTFMISRKITRIYYVLSGTGRFIIAGQKHDVSPGVLMEVPPGVEYCYSGKMVLIAFATPSWFGGNDTHTKWNPDVFGANAAGVIDRGSWVTRLSKATIVRKSPLNAFLRLNRRVWDVFPASWTSLKPIELYGKFLHWLARTQSVRGQAFSTVFLRNPPELELLRRLVDTWGKGGSVRVAVLGCSTGAQAYSVAWKIKSARPDLKLILTAADISSQAVEIAKSGVYSLTSPQLTSSNIAERMSTAEMEEFFHRDGDVVAVKTWIKEGITWHVADAGDPEIVETVGPQDIVVANNFLCHMEPPEAERCLRNIARLVNPGGYLFVSGIDLDVRTKVARDLGWKPVEELLEEIHEADPWLRGHWPFLYAGLEPLNKRRGDWRVRYATAYQVNSANSQRHLGHDGVIAQDRLQTRGITV